MAILNPHFDLPFRLSGNSFAVVEQDTYADIANCVETIIRTPQGHRNDAPDFGNPLEAFDTQPVNVDLLKDAIRTQEPRSDNLVTEQGDAVDTLIDYVRVEVFETGNQ